MFHSSYEFRLRLLPLAVLSNAIHDVGDLRSRVVAFPDETQFQKGQHHLRRQGSKARLSNPVDSDGDSFARTSSLPVVTARGPHLRSLTAAPACGRGYPQKMPAR